MRGAQIDEYGYVTNVFIVPYITFLPNLIEDVESEAAIGDYWNGERFVHSDEPDYPPHP